MANTTAEPPAAPPEQPKPGLLQAIRTILTKPDDTDAQRVSARRRRFVMAAVLGTLGVNLLTFLRFFFPRTLFEPKTTFRFTVSRTF